MSDVKCVKYTNSSLELYFVGINKVTMRHQYPIIGEAEHAVKGPL